MPKDTPQFTPERNYYDAGKQTWKALSEIQKYGYENSQVFRDFVDQVLASLLSLTYNLQYPTIIERLRTNKLEGPYEERYLQFIHKYRENLHRPAGQRPVDYFCKAWYSLQQETQFFDHDVLGELYMREISHGEHGQFFTPIHVSDMMVQLTGSTDGERVSDPACGSGRFFISMNKVKPGLFYEGIDLSEVCAKMTVLNMWLFDLDADIYHGNALSMEMFRLWRVRKGGYIFEMDPKEIPQKAVPSSPPEAPQRPLPAQQVIEAVPTPQPRPIEEQPKVERVKRGKPKKGEQPVQESLFDITQFEQRKLEQ